MRSVKRVLLTGAILALVGVAFNSNPSLARVDSSALLRGGFGVTVIVGDGEVFVGEASNAFRPGMVYVFRKSGSAWQEALVLKGQEAAVGDQFGSSLALDGSTLFIGAGAGAVNVFSKSGSSWNHAGVVTTQMVAGDTTARFGDAVAASGDWLMIGKAVAGTGRGGRGGGRGGRGGRGAGPAPAVPPGEVYVFRRSGPGQFAYQTTLRSRDSAQAAGDAFGSSIAIVGATALIGARGQAANAGVVHEFALESTGMWSPVSSFAAQGLGNDDAFGTALLLQGNQAIVSAPGDGGGYGALYLFRKVEGRGGRGGRGGGGGGGGAGAARGGRAGGANFTWQELVRLVVPVGSRSEGFAASLAADDSEIWSGAPGARQSGGTYIFSGQIANAVFNNIRFLAPGDVPATATGAGASVSIRANVAAIGIPGATRDGGVVIYERTAPGAEWRPQPLIIADIDEIDSYTGSERRCGNNGKAEVFDCAAVELISFLPPSRLTHDGHYIQMNDIWGWTDSQTGKEWALLGRRDGTTFVDISNPLNPVAVADLPLTDGARPASWRDIKVYKDHAYIVSDGSGPHGMQIFDLARLRSLRPQSNGAPVMVRPDTIYREINSAHNIVINEESGYAYSVGSSGGGTTCGGGLHMIDIRQPKQPVFAGCFADTTTGRSGTGYSHDAQCVTYKGPDARYGGHEICVGSNENAISIADVTDKKAPKALSRASYPNVAYSHQGWFTEDHKYFFLDDEIDEINGVPKTRTLVWDLTDLEKPVLAKEHMGVESTSDHNLYIRGTLMFQANYRSGLRVLDIKDPLNPREISFFDTAPYTTNAPGYNGAWSVYPFFKSGTIIVSSIEQGLFMLKVRNIVF